MLDALIIGAGPSGSLAALLLARANWSVALVEQHHFPRDKVCGECLSALGIEVLARHGLCKFSAPPVVLARTLIHAADGSACEVVQPRPMWGISRHLLDQHLLNAAIAAGAKLFQPARCETISPRPTIRNLLTNQIDSVDARFVLRADGKAPSHHATGEFGIKTHFTNVAGPTDAIELFAVNGSYGGLAPIEANRHNAAFTVPAARLRAHHGDVDALFSEITHENRTLEKRLRNARRSSAWLAAPLPRFGVQDDWSDGTIPLGNAAAAIEPIGGEGMGLALRSAEIAATALIASRTSEAPLDLRRLRTAYRRLWGLRGSACRAMAMGMSRRSIASWLVPTASGCDGISSAAMALMGK